LGAGHSPARQSLAGSADITALFGQLQQTDLCSNDLLVLGHCRGLHSGAGGAVAVPVRGENRARPPAPTSQTNNDCQIKCKLSQVCKILAEQEVKPHKVRYYLEQRDPEFEPKMAEILCVYRQVAMLRGQAKSGESQGQNSGGDGSLAIVSYDEKPGIQANRYDRAGSPAACWHQPDRDARSRV